MKPSRQGPLQARAARPLQRDREFRRRRASGEAASEQYEGPFEFAGVIDKVVIDLKWEEGRFATAGEATWTTGNAVAHARGA
ncbi:hypothetical protein FHX10_006511 [Rhizobium sp. BK591]|uniref:hypothetical protein n=1 Tax=Rhizobium sp. BK591 TaxID=2586985 RepID=UPI001050F83D|nr:hypothetical protein [Rhizobium sp. BK591]MBB3746958.1 hypothetical protein [Rhizobium sp. BK591]